MKTISTSSAIETIEQDHELDRATLVQDRVTTGRDAGHDVGEDEQAHALADAALGDQFGEPHDEGRAGGHDRDHEQTQFQVELGDEVDVEAEQRLVVTVEGVDESGRLQECQADREVARRLGDLLLTDGALVTPLRELGDDGREELDHDGARDVGHDAQSEDRESGERATGEEVQEAEHATGAGLGLEQSDLAPTHPGDRDVGAGLVEADDANREQDLVAEVWYAKDVPESPKHFWTLAVLVLVARSGRANGEG